MTRGMTGPTHMDSLRHPGISLEIGLFHAKCHTGIGVIVTDRHGQTSPIKGNARLHNYLYPSESRSSSLAGNVWQEKA